MEKSSECQNIFQDGPHLQAAVLCEKVLDEKDGTKSAIRIIDRVTLTVSTVTPQESSIASPVLRIAPALLIRFKKGNGPNRFELKIELVREETGVEGTQIYTVMMEGSPDSGHDLVANMGLEFQRDGLYWFNLYVDECLVTRVPLRVVFMFQKTVVHKPADQAKPN